MWPDNNQGKVAFPRAYLNLSRGMFTTVKIANIARIRLHYKEQFTG